MNKNELIKNELNKYELSVKHFDIISDANGVIVVRVYTDEKSFILKFFTNDFKREIKLYQLFNKYSIKTIDLYDYKENSMLLADINESEKYRLATKEDTKDPQVIQSLIDWYHSLHQNGKNILLENKLSLYSETEEVTLDAIRFLQEKTSYRNDEFWTKLKANLQLIKDYVSYNQTMTYNDFDYTNMIVSNDKSEAFMFDYNLTGVGLPYFDVRNIVSNPYFDSSITEMVKKDFSYKKIDVLVDEVISNIFSLISAYERESFPNWANPLLEELLEGGTYTKLNELIELFDSFEETEFIRVKANDIILRNARVSDIKLLTDWWSDGVVMEHAGFPNGLVINKESLRRKYIVRNVSQKEARLVIEYQNKPIGEMSFRLVANATYMIGIKLCEQTKQNIGIGTTCLITLFDYLFEQCHAMKIVLDTMVENARARKVYERLGFKFIRINKDCFTDQLGNLRSSVDYELIKTDYDKAKTRLKLASEITEQLMNEDDAKTISEWDYDGDYKMYNLPSWQEMKEKKFSMTTERGRQAFTIYTHQGEIVGFVSLYDRDHFVFLGIGVNPHLVSKGYGSVIMDKAVKKSMAKYPKKIRLEVRSWNERAIKCYQNAGFNITGYVEQTTYIGFGKFTQMELEY